jgi:uncharacterized membrane protein
MKFFSLISKKLSSYISIIKAENHFSFVFFQKMFIFYWIFSILGHYVEVIWSQINHILVGQVYWSTAVPTILPISSPYGLGAIAVIILIWPLIKTHKIKPYAVLLLSIIVTGAVEYICALILTLFTGHNNFWDYSREPFNLNGFVCLQSATVFGAGTTLMIYYFYPFCERAIRRFDKKQIDVAFWIMLTTYLSDLIYSYQLR